MKLNNNKTFAHVYLNRGVLTTTPYLGRIYRSKEEANYEADGLKRFLKKNLKLVKVTLETV